MIEVRRHPEFEAWIGKLKDRKGLLFIAQRLARLEADVFGDVKYVGEGVIEMRVHFGPGYRIYITRRGASMVVLLCGGDKDSQDRDIKRAKELAKEV